MIVYDDVSGLRGRPTSGVLGLLFKIIGEGRVVEARLARTHTGLLLIHGRVEKGFLSKRMTVTIYPNGTSVKGLPQGRSDLRAIAERLRQPIEIKYKPFSL